MSGPANRAAQPSPQEARLAAPRSAAQPVLRPMTVADLDCVMAVEVQAYGHPWSWGNFTDSLAAGYLAEVLQEPGSAAPVGYFVAMPGVEELHLLNITVAPPQQHQGWGLLLLRAVRERAQARDARKVWLEVRAGNERARAFYRAFGFAECGLRRGYYPACASRREDAVVMNLDLSAQAPHAAD